MTAASRGLYARSRGSQPVRQFVSDYEVDDPPMQTREAMLLGLRRGGANLPAQNPPVAKPDRRAG